MVVSPPHGRRYLLIDPNSVQPRVHELHPAVLRGQDEQRHQSLDWGDTQHGQQKLAGCVRASRIVSFSHTRTQKPDTKTPTFVIV